MSLWSFQGAHETDSSYTETPAESAGPSKLSSVRKAFVEVDVLLGELNSRTDLPSQHRISIDGFSAYRICNSGFPRKEVIQPQLPLRLPCYDFTPIINPTFDGSLPCGLGHRLRVLPTFVRSEEHTSESSH